MIDPTNPLSWPLYPVLPLRRRGVSLQATTEDDLGVLYASHATTVPTVYVANMVDCLGRSQADIEHDLSVRRTYYASVNDVLVEWETD